MARTIDFGESQGANEHGSTDACLPERRKLTLDAGGRSSILCLIPSALCSFGRSSERNVPLRVQPTTNEENKRKTFQISSHHFDIRYSGENVLIVDRGSSNGTELKSAGRLVQGVPTELRSEDEIRIAGVLTLGIQIVRRRNPLSLDQQVKEQIATAADDALRLSQLLIGPEKPGVVDFVRIRRLDNCPDEEYVLLFGNGFVDSTGEAMLQLPKRVGTGSRGLDLGADDSGPVARIFWSSRDLAIANYGAAQIRHNGNELLDGGTTLLRPGDRLDHSAFSFVVQE